MKVNRIGSRNCVNCDHYLKCKDDRKSIVFVCDRHRKTDSGHAYEALFMSDALGEDIRPRTELILPSSAHSDPYADAGGFDAFEALKSVINDKRIVSPDIKIPEDDFPEAPNFYTYCVSDQYLDQKPFIEQALMGTELFAEMCPRCTDMEWFDHTHRVNDSLTTFERKVALFEHGKCPHCGMTRLQAFRKKLLNPYYELAACCGQRSGKSAWFGMAGTYITHRVIKLGRPNEVYKLLKANVLQFTMVALTYAQAKDTLWEPFYGNLVDGPWWQRYHEMLDDVGSRYGEELYTLKDTFVNYRHRRVYAYPAGPDKRVLRGRTRIGAGIDELGWFPNDVSSQQNVKMNANEVYVALENSLGTVRQAAKNAIKQGFYNVPFGYFINISSPSSMRDKIMELVRKSQHSRVLMGIQKSTWEMNPTLPRKSDFLKEKFRADPVGAMRDFGAQPPITNSPFIANADYVEQCFSEKKNNIQVSYHVKKSKRGDQQEIYGQVDHIGKSGRRSVLAIDGGYSNNSFAIAVGHLSSKGLPVISLVAEIIPEMGIPIQYSLSYTCFLLPIIAARNVIFATADRWNSLKILSDMETELGLGKQQYSLKYPDMQMFKSYLCDGQILIPKPSMPIKDILAYDHSNYPACFKHQPADHLVLQCLTVQDTGSQVLKGDALTDDILRATMLCTTMLLDDTKREELMGPDKAIEAAVDVKQLMFSRGYSTGISGPSMGESSNPVGLLRSRT